MLSVLEHQAQKWDRPVLSLNRLLGTSGPQQAQEEPFHHVLPFPLPTDFLPFPTCLGNSPMAAPPPAVPFSYYQPTEKATAFALVRLTPNKDQIRPDHKTQAASRKTKAEEH